MKKILIIDDSEDLLEAMKLFLELQDFKVKTLRDCSNVIEEVKQFDPDVLIIDVFLSGEDGRDICRELRNIDETKHLCIMLLSGSHETLKNYKDFGADISLEKPFDIKNLLNKIKEVLATCDAQKFQI